MAPRHLYSFCVLAIVVFAAARSGAQDIAELVEQNEPTVVVLTGIRTETGAEVQSSGCCIDTGGYILTTAHQIVGVKNIRARTISGDIYPVEVLETDKALEISLLKASSPLPAAVRIGRANSLRSGASIFSIATPESLDFTVVPGMVSNTNRTLNGHPVFQADLRVSPGSSGGAVFDQYGQLVGLVIGKLQNVEWVTVVNPVDNAFPMLQKHKLHEPSSTVLPRNMLAPSEGSPQPERDAIEAYNMGVAAGEPNAKLEAYARALQLRPDFFEAWFNQAVVLEGRGELEKSAAAYAKAEALNPNAIEVQRNLGRLHLRAKRPADAVTHFEKAVKLAPDSPQSYNDLGEARRQLDELEAATAAFQRALELDPKYAQAHYNVALVLSAREDTTAAIAHLEQYLALDAAASDAEKVRQWIAELQHKKQ